MQVQAAILEETLPIPEMDHLPNIFKIYFSNLKQFRRGMVGSLAR
jgi:hypothetical protein